MWARWKEANAYHTAKGKLENAEAELLKADGVVREIFYKN